MIAGCQGHRDLEAESCVEREGLCLERVPRTLSFWVLLQVTQLSKYLVLPRASGVHFNAQRL